MILPDKKSAKSLGMVLISGILAGFTNGFLGAGGGIILLWVLRRLNPQKGESAVRDNFATTVAIILLFSTVSAVTYSYSNGVDVRSLAALVLPGVAGGVAGAYLTDRLNTEILKTAFSVIIIVAGINMVF